MVNSPPPPLTGTGMSVGISSMGRGNQFDEVPDKERYKWFYVFIHLVDHFTLLKCHSADGFYVSTICQLVDSSEI